MKDNKLSWRTESIKNGPFNFREPGTKPISGELIIGIHNDFLFFGYYFDENTRADEFFSDIDRDELDSLLEDYVDYVYDHNDELVPYMKSGWYERVVGDDDKLLNCLYTFPYWDYVGR